MSDTNESINQSSIGSTHTPHNATKKKHVLIAPVSGGAFPHQMEIITSLGELGFRPYIAFASSGGNVATYLTFAGGFDRKVIYRIVRDICAGFFVRSWLPPTLEWLPSISAGFFMGSVYQRNPRVTEIFDTYFTIGSVQQMEIWTGATNQKTSASGFFCNRSKKRSIVKGIHYHPQMVAGENLHYMNGDLSMIAKASAASATIPTLVESQEINGNLYVDGGVKYASPFTAMVDEVRSMWERDKQLHMVYVNGYNIEEQMALKKQASEMRNLHGIGSNIPKPDDSSKEMQNIIETGLSATHHMIMGMLLSDRKIAYTLLREISASIEGKPTVYYIDIPNIYIVQVWKILEDSDVPASLMEIYSTCKEYINYTNFQGVDIIEHMAKSACMYNARLWWVTNPDLFSGKSLPQSGKEYHP